VYSRTPECTIDENLHFTLRREVAQPTFCLWKIVVVKIFYEHGIPAAAVARAGELRLSCLLLLMQYVFVCRVALRCRVQLLFLVRACLVPASAPRLRHPDPVKSLSLALCNMDPKSAVSLRLR